MSALRVLEARGYGVVVDLGRHGYRTWGMPPCGALDRFSLVAANRLVGNGDGEAALELAGGRFAFAAAGDLWLATAGAPWLVRAAGAAVPPWTSFRLAAGEVLELVPDGPGFRCYLAVAGGWDVPPVLGSRSTDTLAGAGGLEGRPLRPGDALPAGCPSHPPGERTVPEGARPRLPAPGEVAVLRVLLGPQAEMFPPEALAAFASGVYTVTARSDRSGCRLAGPAVPPRAAEGFVSEPMPTGSIQVPLDGQPIVILAAGPTVGGYPKIAVVIDADLDLAGQLPPGQRVRFRPVGLEEAHAALREYRRAVAALPVSPVARTVRVMVDGVAYRVEIREDGRGGRP